MYIAHSTVGPVTRSDKIKPVKRPGAAELFTQEMALKGRQRALKKYAAEIAEIKEHFPEWEPEFKTK